MKIENEIKTYINKDDLQYPLKKDLYQAIIRFKMVLKSSCSGERKTVIDYTVASKDIPLTKNGNKVDCLEIPIMKPRKIAKTYLLSCM